MKSPFTFGYSDLIKEQEQSLSRMKVTFPALVKSGQMNDWVSKRKIAMQEQLVRMLKKHQKNPQLSLEDLFNQTKWT